MYVCMYVRVCACIIQEKRTDAWPCSPARSPSLHDEWMERTNEGENDDDDDDDGCLCLICLLLRHSNCFEMGRRKGERERKKKRDEPLALFDSINQFLFFVRIMINLLCRTTDADFHRPPRRKKLEEGRRHIRRI